MTTPTLWTTARLYGPGLTLSAPDEYTKQLGEPEIKPLPDTYESIWNATGSDAPAG